ncbi:MAG: GNAT family N-acetyltransferase [Pseudomonadota bacterium]
MGVDIRPLKPTDEAEWRELWRLYLEFYGASVPNEVYTTTFERLLTEDTALPRGLVAEVDGALVGLVHYIFHPHCWRLERVCYLQDLFTSAAHRERGIARSLIEAVYVAADSAGAPQVYWLTEQHNATARRLYDQVGSLTPFIKYNRP